MLVEQYCGSLSQYATPRDSYSPRITESDHIYKQAVVNKGLPPVYRARGPIVECSLRTR